MPSKRFRGILPFFALLLLYVAGLHVWIAHVLPDPFLMPDTVSYLKPALNCFHQNSFNIPDSRGYGYPLFLTVCLKFGCTLAGIAYIQHVIALLTGFLTAWIAKTFLKASWIVSGFIFFFVSGSTRAVFYAHTILTENIFVFLQMCLLAALLLAIYRRSKGWAFTAGLPLALLLTVRPIGQAWLWAWVALGLWHLKSRSFRRLGGSLVLGCLLVTGPLFLINYASRGFWGFDPIL